MPWMKLEAPIEMGPDVSGAVALAILPQYQKTQTEAHGSAIAFYRVANGATATFYLSPAAAALVAGKTKYDFAICPRPVLKEIHLMIGHSSAVDTAWVEKPDDEREPEPYDAELADAQRAEWDALYGNDDGDGEPA